jgi:uncharacterized integral membrane protein
MRKNLFLWSAISILVLTLILAFENIWLVQQYFILFWTINASTTIIVLLASVLGFFVGFFAMLYSFEVRKLKALSEEDDQMGSPPAAAVEETPVVEEKVEEKEAEVPDDFDEDDEVLG